MAALGRVTSVLTVLMMMVVAAGCTAAPPPEPVKGPYLRGVNTMTYLWFEGYEHQAGNEAPASYEYLARHGVAVVRLPISWERIQPVLSGDLATSEVARLARRSHGRTRQAST